MAKKSERIKVVNSGLTVLDARKVAIALVEEYYDGTTHVIEDLGVHFKTSAESLLRGCGWEFYSSSRDEIGNYIQMWARKTDLSDGED